MNFSDIARKESQKKITENGALAFETTNSSLIDFFTNCGAWRNRSEFDITDKFEKAFNENPLLAVKCLFYCRDIRKGGLGERRTFRFCLKWLSDNHPDIVKKNIYLIPTFGRFDDLFCLFDTKKLYNMGDVVFLILNIACDDIDKIKEGKTCSLLGKWLPSCNAHSKESKKHATIVRKGLGLSEKEYRRFLSQLRACCDVVEKRMSTNDWENIKYPAVPSYAMKNYRNAFFKHDPVRFTEYLENVEKGKAKIKASTLYPYDIYESYKDKYSQLKNEADIVLEEQWKALPNYIVGENNYLIMADVSGSMIGRPMATSVSLATYFAQKNYGAYHGLFMTFSDCPNFIDISKETTLLKAFKKVEKAPWGFSTNLEKAFNMILIHAQDNKLKNKDLPKALIIISDMEINNFSDSDELDRLKNDFYEEMKKRFKEAGYDIPKIIFWQVDARNDTFLSQSDEVIFVGGSSPSIFKNLCGVLNGKTTYDLMLEILNDPVYDQIQI